MVKIADIIQKIEEFAPLALAEDFDNCGLKIGNVKEEVSGILVTVDTDLSVIREAKEKGCNFILEGLQFHFGASPFYLASVEEN